MIRAEDYSCHQKKQFWLFYNQFEFKMIRAEDYSCHQKKQFWLFYNQFEFEAL